MNQLLSILNYDCTQTIEYSSLGCLLLKTSHANLILKASFTAIKLNLTWFYSIFLDLFEVNLQNTNFMHRI